MFKEMKEKQTNKNYNKNALHRKSIQIWRKRKNFTDKQKSSAPLNWIDKRLITEDEHWKVCRVSKDKELDWKTAITEIKKYTRRNQ